MMSRKNLIFEFKGQLRFAFGLVLSVVVTFVATAKGSISNHIDEVSGGYNFILYEPDSTDSPRPLIITLHSRSASGTNLADIDRFGTIDAIRSGMELDAVVLAPQATGDKWDADKIIQNIDWAQSNYCIDPNRIYAIGMSMGGNGVADLVAKIPERIAAAIVLAGSLIDGNIADLNSVPLWVIRGLNDRPEAIERTDRMINAMRSQPEMAPRLVYSKVKGLDHRQHERILYMSYFYDWLLSHNLDDPGRSVNKTADIDLKFIKDAYKGLRLRHESAVNHNRMQRPTSRRRR